MAAVNQPTMHQCTPEAQCIPLSYMSSTSCLGMLKVKHYQQCNGLYYTQIVPGFISFVCKILHFLSLCLSLAVSWQTIRFPGTTVLQGKTERGPERKIAKERERERSV